MFRYKYRIYRNLYDPSYIYNINNINTSIFNNKNNYQYIKNKFNNNYSIMIKKSNNYDNQINNYNPKFIDETYNHNYYYKNNCVSYIFSSIIFIYIMSSILKKN